VVAGEPVGSLSLRRRFRRREGWGTTVLRFRRVYRVVRIGLSVGVGWVVVPTPGGIRLPQHFHHRGVAPWGVAGELAVRVWFLDAVVVSRSAAASEDFVLRLHPRRAGVPSVAAVELVGLCTGGPSPAVLAAVLQVVRPTFVGGSDLTAGWIRAGCPADVFPSFFISRRLRRVDDAATLTRLCPLKFPFGDIAAVCWCHGVFSGERVRCFQAAADREESRSHQGLDCVFSFLQGAFCNLWTAVQLLDGSCIFLAT
jgi:hypothetical protein